MKIIIKISGFISFCALLTLPAAGSENGTVAYPLGVNSVYPGLFPVPGETWLQNYTAYYTANRVNDETGNKLGVPKFRATVGVDALRLFHTWNQTIGPFTISSALVLTGATGEIGTPVLSGGLIKGTSLADITIQPLYINYANEQRTFFSYGGIDYFIPTGTWISNNFYSIVPNYSFTWFLTPVFDVSATIGAEIHTQNNKTRYLSGNIVFADYGVNYRFFSSVPELAFGVGGYVATQLTDDKAYGQKLHGRKLFDAAVGPQISYKLPVGAVAVKWQHEFYAENRPIGNRFWVQFYVPFGGAKS